MKIKNKKNSQSTTAEDEEIAEHGDQSYGLQHRDYGPHGVINYGKIQPAEGRGGPTRGEIGEINSGGPPEDGSGHGEIQFRPPDGTHGRRPVPTSGLGTIWCIQNVQRAKVSVR